MIKEALKGFDTKVKESGVVNFSVVGPSVESQEVLVALHKAGARLNRSGPYTDSSMHPEVDSSRYLFEGQASIMHIFVVFCNDAMVFATANEDFAKRRVEVLEEKKSGEKYTYHYKKCIFSNDGDC